MACVCKCFLGRMWRLEPGIVGCMALLVGAVNFGFRGWCRVDII